MSAMSAVSLDDARARTRMHRGPEDAPWELWQRTPAPALRGLVLELWAGLAGPCRHRVLPNGEAALMFHLGVAQRLVERDGAQRDELLRTGFVSGLQERPATFETITAGTRVVTARLSPLGAWLLLGGLPQSELARGVFEVSDVIEPRSAIAELHERMLHAADLGGALDLLERWLLARLRVARAPHPAIRALHAAARVRAASSIEALAADCGLSPRRLRELCLEQLGLPPKRLSRIVRFRGALERIARAPDVDLGRVALDCGYYDQPHMNRDFRQLALMTPRQYLDAVGDGLDGADVIGG